jgi:short-subunit dehydrogenase
MKELRGKYALVTGAAGGIGTVLCQLLARKGAHLVLVDLHQESLEQLKVALLQQYPSIQVKTFSLDLTDYTAVKEMASSITHLDILINNAGVAFGGSFDKMNYELMYKTLTVNLLSTIHLTHTFMSLLKKNSSSNIVNVASGAGLVGPGGMVAYGASKFGLVGFSEALHAELKEDKITVSVVCPGFVKTDLINNSASKGSGKNSDLAPLNAMVQKEGDTPEKVAQAVIRAIEKNKTMIKVGMLTKGGHLIKRFLPSLANYLNAKNYQKLKKEGTIK